MLIKNWYSLTSHWCYLNLLTLRHFQLAVKVPRGYAVGADLAKLKKVGFAFPSTVLAYLL